eukprot:848041-Amphidinium_carterae.1
MLAKCAVNVKDRHEHIGNAPLYINSDKSKLHQKCDQSSHSRIPMLSNMGRLHAQQLPPKLA